MTGQPTPCEHTAAEADGIWTDGTTFLGFKCGRCGGILPRLREEFDGVRAAIELAFNVGVRKGRAAQAEEDAARLRDLDVIDRAFQNATSREVGRGFTLVEFGGGEPRA